MTTIDRLSCRFDDPGAEAGFRAWSLAQDRARARIAIIAAIPVVLLFIRADYLLFGASDPFPTLVGVRLAFVAYSAVALLAFARVSTPRFLDGLILTWSLVSAMALSFVGFVRPPSYAGHVMMEVVAVFFLCAVMPNRLWFQLVAAAVMAGGTVFVAVVHGLAQDPILGQVVLGANGAALAFGGLVSWDSHVSRRRLYRAMMDVKTLHGLIRMCSRCKRIRDHEGLWGRVEEYLARRTDAEVRHGYCPECYAEVTADLT